MQSLATVLRDIRKCQVCAHRFGHAPRPVLNVHKESSIALIGQAPGLKVHESGIPWEDKSGDRLRLWLGVDQEAFYDPRCFAILPMGFCYPGRGKSGDLPPSPECAPLWHEPILQNLPNVRLTLLIGQYAQGYYLGDDREKNLTETVRNFRKYLPDIFVLPHPSPRNNIWMKKNPWFENEALPVLQSHVQALIKTQQ